MKLLLIFCTLTVILGISPSNAKAFGKGCFIQGSYNLIINGFSTDPIELNGFINSGISTTYVSWKAYPKSGSGNNSYYQINESFKGENVQLALVFNGINFVLSGTIHGTYVSWIANGFSISGYQPCIP